MQQYPSYSPKQTLWLLFKEHRADSEERFVQCLLAQSDLIARTHEFVPRFRQILTDRDETALQPWAYEAEASRIPELVRFVQRFRLDWEAVENALLEALSQGQVEGQVNRLKVGHRDKAMDALVLLSYKHDYWEQASSTESGHDPQKWLTLHANYQLPMRKTHPLHNFGDFAPAEKRWHKELRRVGPPADALRSTSLDSAGFFVLLPKIMRLARLLFYHSIVVEVNRSVKLIWLHEPAIEPEAARAGLQSLQEDVQTHALVP